MSLLLRRGLISSGRGGIFAANTANLNSTTQYFNAGNKFDAGTSDISMTTCFKTSDAGTIMIMSKSRGSSTSYVDMVMFSGNIQARAVVDASNIRLYQTQNTFNDGNWHHVVAYCDRSAGTWDIIVDGVSQTTDITTNGSITSSITNTEDFIVGGRHTADLLFDGSMGFSGIALGVDLTLNGTELYNSGTPLCYDNFSAGLKSKFAVGDFWELSNWTGHTGQELTGQANSNTLTNIGTTPFTGAGLNVECT